MAEEDAEPRARNADLKRSIVRLVTVIVFAVAGVLGLVWYLWQASPKPP